MSKYGIDPSWKQGFAPRDGLPAYSGLLTGMQNYWVPAYGGTGQRLVDVLSGHHGTLNNMTGANWVAGDPRVGGPGLLFSDAGNDSATVNSAIVALGSPNTMTAWVHCFVNSYVAGSDYIIDSTDGSVGFAIRILTSTELRPWIVRGGAAQIAVFTYPGAGSWLSIVIRMNAANVRCYVNTVIGMTQSGNPGQPMNAASTMRIGSDFAGSNRSNITLAAAGIWKRALSFSEVCLLNRDPLAPGRLADTPFAATVAAPVGAIMNQLQGAHLGADLYNGALIL